MDNLIKLDKFDEESILSNLKTRYDRDDIYTNVGSILVSINPFKTLTIYSTAVLNRYQVVDDSLPPHVFGAASRAYNQMREDNRDQSFIISGESGAGKTETTKLVLQYLSEVAGSQGGVEQEILHSNPLLEAFGNAKTVRNDNSSRFGKYLAIRFDTSGKIDGASVTSYLLERSRVVTVANTERTYHIFYQMCEAASAEQRSAYNIGPAKSYKYLSQSGCLSVPSVDDHNGWKATLRALANLKFVHSEIEDIVRVLSTILHVGNVDLVQDKKSEMAGCTNPQQIAVAASVLKVETSKLSDCLLFRHVTVRGDTTKSPFTLEGAIDARDALSKALYGRLFKWIVDKINKSLSTTKTTGKSICVLDIFGFESFEFNSLEQLFINYANEKLQQIFNNYVFKMEQKEYASEGIPVERVEFVDNQKVLDLIEQKGGILATLDEEVVVPKGSDQGFLDKIVSAATKEKHENFQQNRKVPGAFIIIHYAGQVSYTTKGFLEKNRDKLLDSIQSLLIGSSSTLIKELFTEDTSKGGKVQTLGTQFRNQLKALSDDLGKTQPHFIRCIKPNTEKKGNIFTSAMVLEQLRFCGLLETVKIRSRGFPNREETKIFWHKYACCLSDKKTMMALKKSHPTDACKQLLENLKGKLDLKEIAVGKSKVFWRSSQTPILYKLRAEGLSHAVKVLQGFARVIMAKNLLKDMRKMFAVCRAAIDSGDKSKIAAAIAQLEEQPFELFILYELQDLQALLEEAAFICRKLEAAATGNSISDVDAAVEKAREFIKKSKNYKHKDVDKMIDTALKAKDRIKKEEEERIRLQKEREEQEKKERLEREKREKEEREAAKKAGLPPPPEKPPAPSLPAAPRPGAPPTAKPTGSRPTMALPSTEVKKSKPPLPTFDDSECRVCRKKFDDSLKARRCKKCRANVCQPHSSNIQTVIDVISPGVQKTTKGYVCDACFHGEGTATEVDTGNACMRCQSDVTPGVGKPQRKCRVCLQTVCFPCSLTIKTFKVEFAPGLFKDTKGHVCTQCASSSEPALDKCLCCGLRFTPGQETRKCGQCQSLVCQLCSENLKELSQQVSPGIYTRAKAHVCLNCFKLSSKAVGATGATSSGPAPPSGPAPESAKGPPPQAGEQFQKAQTPSEAYTIFIKVFKGAYPLSDFRGLRRPNEYIREVRSKPQRTELLKSMYSWQKAPIPGSLFKLTPVYCRTATRAKQCNEQAIATFKNIQIYMLDRFHSMPATLGYEVVKVGFEEPLLRDEIYCQLIKQTNENTNPESNVLGWRLMYACLTAFLPFKLMSHTLLSHVASFARPDYTKPEDLKFETVPDIAAKCYWQFKKTFKKGSGTLMSLRTFTMRGNVYQSEGGLSEGGEGRETFSATISVPKPSFAIGEDMKDDRGESFAMPPPPSSSRPKVPPREKETGPPEPLPPPPEGHESLDLPPPPEEESFDEDEKYESEPAPPPPSHRPPTRFSISLPPPPAGERPTAKPKGSSYLGRLSNAGVL